MPVILRAVAGVVVAIFHLTATVISRSRGQSMVAAAAYRLGVALRDERYGIAHNYVGKRRVTLAETLVPLDAPTWAQDRQTLWNAVEAREHRKDAQLARLIEVSLPLELSPCERAVLLRDYLGREFVSRGMVADFCVRGEPDNPHAHVLLTMRAMTAAGFGRKERAWNGKAVLLRWRAAWAQVVNEHLARAGHVSRIDHRTLADQRSELLPGRRVGVARARRAAKDLPAHLAARLADQQRIAANNGALMLEDPASALRTIARHQPVFGEHDLSRFLRTRCGSETQFEAVWKAVLASDELVPTSVPGGAAAFTTRDLLEAGRSLSRRCAVMLGRRGHAVPQGLLGTCLARATLTDEERRIVHYVMSEGDLKALVLQPDCRLRVLAVGLDIWTGSGLALRAVVAPGVPVPEGDGIDWCTPEECEVDEPAGGGWPPGVLLVDAAHRLPLKQLERLLAMADRARAKAVLLADAGEFAAHGAATAFGSVLEAIGTTGVEQ